jgi:hypothetical protein
MRLLQQLLVLGLAAWAGLALLGSVVSQPDADVWFRPAPGSAVMHVHGDVSHPIGGGLRVRTPDGVERTYPNAQLEGLAFEPRPYALGEALAVAAIVLAVAAVGVWVAWPDVRRLLGLF